MSSDKSYTSQFKIKGVKINGYQPSLVMINKKKFFNIIFYLKMYLHLFLYHFLRFEIGTCTDFLLNKM